jgi:transcriptional regulator with XRE-family HTH domain
VHPTKQWLTQPDGLADRLRAIRTQAGPSGKQLAARLGWPASKVSRIENGRQMPSSTDVAHWADACGASAEATADLQGLLTEARTEHRDWQRRTRHGQSAVQASYNKLTEDARLIRYFETVYVPGFLQTAEYARRVLAEMVVLHRISVDDVDAAVATRMRRQHMLYDPGKRFEFLLTEPVLRWMLCPADVMRGQLDRLQTIIGVPNIRFGVIPLNAATPLQTAPQNSFHLYDRTGVVETFVGETVHRDDESAAAYARAMDRLWEDAVTGDGARQLIVRAVNDLPAGEPIG